MHKHLIPLACLGFAASSANAALIAGVTINDFSSELVTAGTSTFNRFAANVINGSGFDANTGFHSNSPNNNMWLTTGTLSTVPVEDRDPIGSYPNSFIEFDLGDNYDLASTTVWNYNEVNLSNRGANSVTISVAAAVAGPFTSLGNFTFTQAPGEDDVDFGQIISFSGADNVRLVRFDITSNHGGNNNFVGLSEVRFTAVPEPSAALLGGLGLLALLRRRR